MGKLSRAKGRAFEQKIARQLREIYDDAQLRHETQQALDEKNRTLHNALLKQSNVRRSDQGKGAQEPDLVVQGCPCWFELYTGKSDVSRTKLQQAAKDVRDTRSPLLPVAVVHLLGKQKIAAVLRFDSLAKLVGLKRRGVKHNPVVSVDWEDFKAILREHHV